MGLDAVYALEVPSEVLMDRGGALARAAMEITQIDTTDSIQVHELEGTDSSLVVIDTYARYARIAPSNPDEADLGYDRWQRVKAELRVLLALDGVRAVWYAHELEDRGSADAIQSGFTRLTWDAVEQADRTYEVLLAA